MASSEAMGLTIAASAVTATPASVHRWLFTALIV